MKIIVSLLVLLGATVTNAIEMSTPSTPWFPGENVTETWTSGSGDPASFSLVMFGDDKPTILIEELVPTSLGAYTFAVPNVTAGEWELGAANIGNRQVIYASSGPISVD